ncbi:hypothetical protein [Engelhardtia mirabilis]
MALQQQPNADIQTKGVQTEIAGENEVQLLAEYKAALSKLDGRLAKKVADEEAKALRQRRADDLAQLSAVADHLDDWATANQTSPPLTPWHPVGVSVTTARLSEILHDHKSKVEKARVKYIKGQILQLSEQLKLVLQAQEVAREAGDTQLYLATGQEASVFKDQIDFKNRQLEGLEGQLVLVFNGYRPSIFLNGEEILQSMAEEGVFAWRSDSLRFFPGDLLTFQLSSPWVYRSLRATIVLEGGERIDLDRSHLRFLSIDDASIASASHVSDGEVPKRGRVDDKQSGNLPSAWMSLGMPDDASEWIGLPDSDTSYALGCVLP